MGNSVACSVARSVSSSACGSIVGLGIVKEDLALNLSSAFTASSDTIADRSGNDNDATLHTGVYISTGADGYISIPIDVDLEQNETIDISLNVLQGSPYGLNLSAVSGGTTEPIGGGWGGSGSSEWLERTTGIRATSAGTTNVTELRIGWSGSDFTDAGLSEMVVSVDGVTIGIYDLNDSAAADLGGYICHDSSGNGNHGEYVNCEGHSAEEGILQMAGLDFNRDRRDYNNVSIDTDFSASRSPFENAVNGSYVLDQDGIGPTGDLRDNCIKLTPDAVDQVHYMRTTGSIFNTARACYVQLEIYIPSANTQFTGVGLMVNNGSYTTGSNDGVGGYVYSTPFETQGEWVTISGYLESTLTGSRLLISFQNSDDITFANTNVESVYIREILAYEAFDEALIVPEDTSNLGFDVRGNAITNPRPNPRARNAQDSSDYIEVADDDSLDSINTFAAWYYFEGNAQAIIDFSGGSDSIKIEISSGGVMTSTGLTEPAYYVGDKTTSMSNTASVGSVGWKYIAVTFRGLTPTASIKIYGIGGDDLLYLNEKTLSELERNRKATKAPY